MSATSVSAGAVPLDAEIAATPPGACASCGAGLLGDYCHACGERRVRPEEMTLRTFARDVASEVADLDSRAYRSLRYLFTRPGFLTAEWVAGRRRIYLGPLKLYLAAFAAILLAGRLLSRAGTDSARGVDQTWAAGVVDLLAARLDVSRDEALARLNATGLSHLSWLSVLIPLLMAALLALVFLRRRHGYVEHLVFAAHVSAFYFALGIAAMLLQPAAERWLAVGEVLLGAVMLGVMWIYLWRAVSCVYGDRGWRAGLRSGVLVLGFNLAQAVAGMLAMGTAVLALLYL